MNFIKNIFTKATGYWLHKLDTLPVGADIFADIHHRIGYGSICVMFDVGANDGQTFQWFRYNETQTTIYCFEPVAATFDRLKKNVSTGKKIILENIAFGEVKGEKTIRLFDQYSYLNSLKDELMNQDRQAVTEKINIDTIDDYCNRKKIQKIDFLKIDTEGYELNVLEGASSMLMNAAISFIYCEVGFLKQNRRNTNFAELNEWLAKRNYYFFGIYQLGAHAWKEGEYFGNALFVHIDVFNPK